MASRNVVLKGDVHIPPCKECKESLQQLNKALTEKGVTCISKYRINGLPERWFKEAFDNCHFTVIHKCPFLWEKMKGPLQKMTETDFEKISIITFPDCKEPSERDQGFDKFFQPLYSTDLTDKESLSQFVEEFVEVLNEEKLKQRPHLETEDPEFAFGPNIANVSREHGWEVGEEIKDDDHGLDYEGFALYPDAFGDYSHPRLYVRKECLNSDTRLKYSNALECAQSAIEINNMLTKLPKDQLMPHLKHIYHKVLPQLYKSQDMVGVASFTNCNQLAIQNRAAILLEFMLFESQAEYKHLDQNKMIEVESLLWSALSAIDTLDGKEKLGTRQRLAGLYVMLLCNFILSATSPAEIRLCDVHMETVQGRSLPASMASVNVHLKGIKKRSEQLKTDIGSFVDKENNNSKEKFLLQEQLTVQIAVVFTYLKKMFRDLNKEDLEFVERFVNSKDMQADCSTSVLMAGMAYLFLTKHNQPVHQHQPSSFDKAVEIVKTLLSLRSPFSEESILCLRDPKVREAVSKNDIALTEVEQLLCPLLTDVVTQNPKDNSTFRRTVDWKSGDKDSKWKSVTGNFNNKRVLMWVLKSDDRSKSRKLNPTEDKYCNEMQKLSQLRHKNIVQMLAYQDSNSDCTTFYITEDWPNNLQFLLKNKKDAKQYLSQRQLLEFLKQAADAVEYCHGQEVVHRNLTAASLLLTNDNSVKLCDFTVSQKLVDGRWIENKKNKIPIAARWTAPEYLRRREYTKASDVWMFGHLIYELLTHGLLPYSIMEELDLEKLVDLISKESTTLMGLFCLKEEHMKLISDCTWTTPGKRPDISEVKQRLVSPEFSIASDSVRIDYLQLSDKCKSSVEGELTFGIIPSTNWVASDSGASLRVESECFGDQGLFSGYEPVAPIVLSDTFIRFKFTEKKMEIFREKLEHRIPLETQRKIENGDLSEILSEIKIVQNVGEAYSIDCYVPGICRDNLLKVTLQKSLGENLQPYVDCLCQIASILKGLSPQWILGDICAANIYILKDEVKAYIVSLAYLHLKENSEQLGFPRDTDVLSRAAPEVMTGGNFLSSASDVYCFANLLWEVLKAYDCPKEDAMSKLEEFLRPKASKQEMIQKSVSDKWEINHEKPECCPRELYDLMIKCTHQMNARRISVEELVAELYDIYKSTFGCDPTSFK